MCGVFGRMCVCIYADLQSDGNRDAERIDASTCDAETHTQCEKVDKGLANAGQRMGDEESLMSSAEEGREKVHGWTTIVRDELEQKS